MIELNKEYELTSIGINNYGKGVTKYDDFLVFVDDLYKDETALVKITKKEKNYAFGKMVKLIKKSPYRINNVCGHSNDAGTCPFSDITYEYELEIKKEMVLKNINRALKTDISDIEIVSGDKIEGYRNKVTVFFNENYKFGYFMEESNDFVEVDSCVQIEDGILKIIKSTLDLIKKYKISCANFKSKKGIIKGVVIRKSEYKKIYSVMILATKVISDKFSNVSLDLHNMFKDIVGISYNINDTYDTFIYSGELLSTYGSTYIEEKIMNTVLKVNPYSFLQVNTSCASKLYKEAIEISKCKKTDTVFDLYCGCGGISLNAAPFCKHVYGIETVKSAVDLARKNALYNDIKNATFYTGDSKDFNKIIGNKDADILFVDPPRAGLSKETIEEILKCNFRSIVYVSCDSYTLARDLKLLTEKYELKSIKCFNMFPRTHHVETVCLLELKK